MIQIRQDLTPASLEKKIHTLFDASAQKLRSIQASWNPAKGAPVFTIKGEYTSRGWT